MALLMVRLALEIGRLGPSCKCAVFFPCFYVPDIPVNIACIQDGAEGSRLCPRRCYHLAFENRCGPSGITSVMFVNTPVPTILHKTSEHITNVTLLDQDLTLVLIHEHVATSSSIPRPRHSFLTPRSSQPRRPSCLSIQHILCSRGRTSRSSSSAGPTGCP